jgi:hypothetical protein
MSVDSSTRTNNDPLCMEQLQNNERKVSDAVD